MGDDALELVAGEFRAQTSGNRHAGMLRIAASGEGIGSFVGDQENVGRRHAGRNRHFFHHVKEFRVAIVGNGPASRAVLKRTPGRYDITRNSEPSGRRPKSCTATQLG